MKHSQHTCKMLILHQFLWFLLNLQENGRTVLFYAVASGILDLAEKLLKQGADLNIADMVGRVNFRI